MLTKWASPFPHFGWLVYGLVNVPDLEFECTVCEREQKIISSSSYYK